MNEFIENLKRQAQANPLMAVIVGTAAVSAVGKFIDAYGRQAGSRAYARQVDNRTRNPR